MTGVFDFVSLGVPRFSRCLLRNRAAQSQELFHQSNALQLHTLRAAGIQLDSQSAPEFAPQDSDYRPDHR